MLEGLLSGRDLAVLGVELAAGKEVLRLFKRQAKKSEEMKQALLLLRLVGKWLREREE